MSNKNKMIGFVALLLMTLSTLGAADKIQWMTNYQEALKQAQSTKKPIVLFFTGSDWCAWCTKLEQEALDTKEFATLAGDHFVFVKLDFPSKTKLPPAEEAQNKELQNRYSVRGFPTIVLLNPDQKQIGVTGYRPGGGRDYANHLLKMAQDYRGYKQQMTSLQTQPLSGKELIELHEKAKEFYDTEDADTIAIAGLNSEEAPYFALERLRELSAKGQGKGSEATALRRQLLESDPDNAHHMHYHLAVLEFEQRYQEMKKGRGEANTTLSPLVAYIEKFGQQDKENIWRLQIIICQVLCDQHRYKEALSYAESSYENAPSALKPDIAHVIQDIKAQR